jgi:hypothetical protein
MAYDHLCFSCGGQGRRRSGQDGYEYLWIVGRTTPEFLPAPESTECSDCRGSGLSEGHAAGDCPKCAKARQDLGPLLTDLQGVLRPATLLKFQATAGGTALPPIGTRLGGTPYAESGEAWPRCSRCHGGLTFIGQFDLRGTDAPPLGLLGFYYCWTCRPSGGSEDVPGSWALRSHLQPEAAKAIPIGPEQKPSQETRPGTASETLILSHPDWDEVEPNHPKLFSICTSLSAEEPSAPYRAAVRDLVGDYTITDQMGGFGRWIQSSPRRKCTVCRAALDFVVQVDSHAEFGCDWGLSGLAYLLACRAHPSEVALELQRT